MRYVVKSGSFTQYVDGEARVFSEGDVIELSPDDSPDAWGPGKLEPVATAFPAVDEDDEPSLL